ncbi:MAG: AAA family ATPase [Planctomycetes bacterium]|nr:AAA family ATPase [Planctomycetota bacterium]
MTGEPATKDAARTAASAAEIAAAAALFQRIEAEVAQVLVGQRALVRRLLVALLADGHALIEGVPGLGKSLAVAALAQASGLAFKRIQFTPDLLPADVIGTQIFRPGSGDFSVRRGPLFAELVLADEINRAPPKVQSALLEAMQERQVTIGEQSLPLPVPFIVFATQNPLEHEGTYPLPEAELDRFLFQVRLGYPERSEEEEILRRHGRGAPARPVQAVTSRAELLAARALLERIHAEPAIHDYVLRLVAATRDPARKELRLGASPRAALALLVAAKAAALLAGRAYVTPGDVKELAPDVLRHRLLLSFEAEAAGRTVDLLLVELLRAIPAP